MPFALTGGLQQAILSLWGMCRLVSNLRPDYYMMYIELLRLLEEIAPYMPSHRQKTTKMSNQSASLGNSVKQDVTELL